MFITFFASFTFKGVLWGRFGRARRCPQRGLCVAMQLCVFQLRQELLLQDDDHTVWSIYSSFLGVRVFPHYLPTSLVRDPFPQGLRNLYGVLAKVLRNIYFLLFGAHFWNLWSNLQQYCCKAYLDYFSASVVCEHWS